MNKKSVILTLLEPNEGLMRLLGEELSRVGLNVSGHFYEGGTDAMGALATELSRENQCDMWIIAGNTARINDPVTRRELSLLALAARAERQTPLKVIFSPSAQGAVPFKGPLADSEFVIGTLGAKAVAAIHKKSTVEPTPYRLHVRCLPGLGLWLEAGPVSARNEGPWKGAFLACCGTDAKGAPVVPVAHGVGLAERIPERSTLEYPVQGMKIEHGNAAWEGWGVANTLTPDRSYFVKLSDIPAGIMFGPFPGEDDPELFVISLE